MATREIRYTWGPNKGKVKDVEVSAANDLIANGRAEATEYNQEPAAAADEPSAPARPRRKLPRTIPGRVATEATQKTS